MVSVFPSNLRSLSTHHQTLVVFFFFQSGPGRETAQKMPVCPSPKVTLSARLNWSRSRDPQRLFVFRLTAGPRCSRRCLTQRDRLAFSLDTNEQTMPPAFVIPGTDRPLNGRIRNIFSSLLCDGASTLLLGLMKKRMKSGIIAVPIKTCEKDKRVGVLGIFMMREKKIHCVYIYIYIYAGGQNN